MLLFQKKSKTELYSSKFGEHLIEMGYLFVCTPKIYSTAGLFHTHMPLLCLHISKTLLLFYSSSIINTIHEQLKVTFLIYAIVFCSIISSTQTVHIHNPIAQYHLSLVIIILVYVILPVNVDTSLFTILVSQYKTTIFQFSSWDTKFLCTTTSNYWKMYKVSHHRHDVSKS